MKKIDNEIMDIIVVAGLEKYAEIVNDRIEESANDLIEKIQNADYSRCTKKQAIRSLELDIDFICRSCSVGIFSDLMFKGIDKLMDKAEIIENELKTQFKKQLYANL